MDNILIALIGAAGSGAGAILGIFVNTKLINYRLEQLENKVNKHNNIIERTYELEKRESVLEEKLRVANNRIKDLENESKED